MNAIRLVTDDPSAGTVPFMRPLDKQFVLILSTMRSGSTLLKALLGAAPDVSHLEEVDFQRFCDPAGFRMLASISEKRIIVLKKPAWFTDVAYPLIPPFEGIKLIVLKRNAYDTAVSAWRMLASLDPSWRSPWNLLEFAENYWSPVYENIIRHRYLTRENALFLTYEELVSNPLDVTRTLFEFIGSSQREGVKAYRTPETGAWRWKFDDAGDKIKSLQVQATPVLPAAEDILRQVVNERVQVEMIERAYEKRAREQPFFRRAERA